MNQLEEGNNLNLDFQKLSKKLVSDVIPVVIQDNKTKNVLMLGYMNQLALNKTIKTNIIYFWSTSKNKLWKKGEESGNILKLIEIFINCEQNSLLCKVEIQGVGACHTQNNQGKYRKSCFYRKIYKENNDLKLGPPDAELTPF